MSPSSSFLINYFNIPNEIYLFSINDIICSPSSELIPRLICFTLISLFPYLSIGCHNVIYFLYPHDAPLLFIYYFCLLHFSQFSSIHWYDIIYFKSKYQQCTVTVLPLTRFWNHSTQIYVRKYVTASTPVLVVTIY